MLLHDWLGGHWEWLIVFCDSNVRQSDISDIFLEISEIIIRHPSSKRVVILTPFSIQRFSDFVAIKHEFNFELLSDESQEIVLDKTICFQGCEVTMRSVLQRHGNVQHVLGPELVTDMITEGTLVNIGGGLQENTENYDHRILDRNLWLHMYVLKSPNSYSGIFAVTGIKKKDLTEIVPSHEIVGIFYLHKEYLHDEWTENYDAFKSSRFILRLSVDLQTCFLKLCEKHSGKTLHWVEFNNGDLLWKKS
jgi:hypothetical protein